MRRLSQMVPKELQVLAGAPRGHTIEVRVITCGRVSRHREFFSLSNLWWTGPALGPAGLRYALTPATAPLDRVVRAYPHATVIKMTQRKG